MKFGGTSVANGKKIRHVAKIISDNNSNDCKVVAVVSALEGITNQLIQAAEEAKKGNREYILNFKSNLLEKHLTAAKKAINNSKIENDTEQVLRERINELEQILTGIIYIGELTSKSRDTVIAFGEKLSAPIISGALKNIGLESEYLTAFVKRF